MDNQAAYMRDGLTETKKAADAAKKSADVAEQALIPSQRAYMTLDVYETGRLLTEDTEEHIGFMIVPKVRNTGNTPAINCSIQTEKIVIDKEMRISEHAGPTRNTSGKGGLVVGGGNQVGSKEIPVSFDEIGKAINGEITIIVHVYCEYRDVFKDTPTRRMTGCFLVGFKADPRKHGNNAFRFQAGPAEHNYSD